MPHRNPSSSWWSPWVYGRGQSMKHQVRDIQRSVEDGLMSPDDALKELRRLFDYAQEFDYAAITDAIQAIRSNDTLFSQASFWKQAFDVGDLAIDRYGNEGIVRELPGEGFDMCTFEITKVNRERNGGLGTPRNLQEGTKLRTSINNLSPVESQVFDFKSRERISSLLEDDFWEGDQWE